MPAPIGLNITPVAPSDAYWGNTSMGCDDGGHFGWYYLPSGNSTLVARVAAGVSSVDFHIQDTTTPGTDILSGTGTVGSDSTASFAFDSTPLLDGHVYTWHAVSRDAQGNASDPTTPGCHFRIDRTAPTISVQAHPSQYPAHQSGWGLSVRYSHPVQADNVVPHGCLEYRLNDSTTWIRPTCDGADTWALAQVTFDHPGLNTVHVRAQDEGGNWSQEIQTTQFVYPGPTLPGDLWEPKAQWQLSRSSAGADAAGNLPLTATGGVTYPDNSASYNGSSLPDTVAHLDGTGHLASAGLPAVDTTKSFTITTWARATSGGGIVASQDGNQASGFILWANPWDNNWHFSMASSDSAAYSWDDTAVTSGAAVQYGTWQQLTATYNAQDGFLQLYVNGLPVGSGYHAPGAAWSANGAFRIGQFPYQGQPAMLFHGDISDVAAVSRAAAYPERDGTYLSGNGSNLCLDTYGVATNGTRAQIGNCGDVFNKAFSIDRPDGTVQYSGKCLDVTGNATNNGAAIELWDCNGGGNQVWEPRADGSLYNPQSGRCLDIPFAATTYGTPLDLWDCNNGTNQKWAPSRAPVGFVPLQ